MCRTLRQNVLSHFHRGQYNRKPIMIELSGYVFETLCEDEEFSFCRGRRDHDEPQTVLLIAPVSERPVPAILERLEHEYSLRDKLDSDWAARPLTLIRREGRPMLLLEDAGGEPLDRLLGRPMELSRFFRFAVGLASSLGALHQQGLIHKDIKPANVLVDSASGAVWLTGFGIASRLPRERQSPEPPEVIAGTLAYMAPEQTGRMNRSIDSRSDLYSLGVTLYEMLTGAPSSGLSSARSFTVTMRVIVSPSWHAIWSRSTVSSHAGRRFTTRRERLPSGRSRSGRRSNSCGRPFAPRLRRVI
jgi:serine/threonine protein kinase